MSNYGELFYATDLGENWERRYNFEQWGLTHVSFPDKWTGFIWSELHTVLYKTIDGGITWSSIEVPPTWTQSAFFLDNKPPLPRAVCPQL